jgi:16S rRNA (guanine527-N7)-methyltransferase
VSTRELLVEGVRALRLDVGSAQLDRLVDFLELLAKWNRTHNLTSIREPAQMVTHHLLDALAVLPSVPDRAPLRLLDVGTGGGVPGIPLAIARPQWHMTLLDSNHKKAAFVTQAKLELSLPNVEIIVSRIEDYRPAERFDVVISRAFSDLHTFVEGALPCVADEGLLIAMKGAMPKDEIGALPATVDVEATPALEVPGLGASRHLIIMRRSRGSR